MEPKRGLNDPARNPDPITKAPGAHPIGSGVGAAVGGAAGVGGAIAAGAAMGAAAGPVGTVVGAVVGGVVGGLIGKGVAEHIDPTIEHEYWRNNYVSRPYVTKGASYDEYGPAYQYGWEAWGMHSEQDFDDVEGLLGTNWDRRKGKSRLTWEQAKEAARDSWERVGEREEDEE